MTSTTSARDLLAPRTSSRPLVDAALAAVALLGTVSQFAHTDVHPPPGMDLVGVLIAVAVAAPLLLWRRFPLGVFVASAAANAALAGLGYPVDLVVGPTLALYLLAAGRGPHAPWRLSTTLTVVGMLAAYLLAAGLAQRGFPGVELLHTGLASAAAWFAGERTRLRREQTAELHARAERAERDVERERLLAVAEERARIARDLHDSAGHAISLIAVRAGAARLRHAREPDNSLAALTAIEELARGTAAELDGVVGGLREAQPGGRVEAPAGLASVDTLIAQHAATGLDVTVDQAGVTRSLPGAADQAAYRILQEALTNAARYGTGTARAVLSFGYDQLEIFVTNPVGPAVGPRANGGHGLVGMRERAALLGGDLDTGHTGDAFQLRARIPYGRHP